MENLERKCLKPSCAYRRKMQHSLGLSTEEIKQKVDAMFSNLGIMKTLQLLFIH